MRKAFIFLAGGMFEKGTDRDSIRAVYDYILDYLKDKEYLAVRSVIFLAEERFSDAPLFLSSGFEVYPADSEAFQIALSCSFEIHSPAPPDEIILGFGETIPDRILTHLDGCVFRTLLCRGAENFRANGPFDHLLDLNAIATNESVSVTVTTEKKTSPAVTAEMETPAAITAEKKTPATVATEKKTPATVATEKKTPATVATEKKTPTAVTVEKKTPPDVTAEKKTSPDVTAEMKTPAASALPESLSLSDSWTDSILKAVDESGGKITMASLLDFIKGEYPIVEVLGEAFMKTLLPKSLTCLDEEGTLTVYRADNAELRVVSAEEAIAQLNFRGEKPAEAPFPSVSSSHCDFALASERAKLLKAFCRQKVQRQTGAGKISVEEFESQSRNLGVHLWPTETFSDENLLIMADCYEALEIAGRVMNGLINGDYESNLRPEDFAQHYADAVCLLKSAMKTLDLDLTSDGVQRSSYETLCEFTKSYSVFLNNLSFEDFLNPQQGKDLKKYLIETEKKLNAPKDHGKKKKSLQKKIVYHLDRIREKPPGEIHDWNKVVEGVTSLCRDYNTPYTSSIFKGYLLPFIDKIPENVDLNGTFINIVQHIEVSQDPEAVRTSASAVRELKISNAVRKVRKHYKGTRVVFVGGTPVPHLIKRFKDYFQTDFYWEESSHGDSLERYRSILNDENTKLILVYIPWCSHKHSEEFAQWAKSVGKDFVRIPKGTNPDMIAATVCNQLGLK